MKLPLATALEQLPRGAIRIPFRELRQYAPGFFMGGGDLDEAIVDVPLSEVVSRLSPSHLVRRGQQKQVAIAQDIPTVFSSSTGAPARARPRPAAVAVKGPVAKDDLVSSRVIAQRVIPVEQKKPATSELGPAPHRSVVHPSLPSRVPVSPAANPASVKEPAEPTSTQENEPIKVALVSLARNWPEPMRRDVMATHLAASINIPFADLRAAMKRGRAVFTWKQLRMWMSPKPSTALTEHDAASLELPLAVLAPLFMARMSTGQKERKVQSAADIPDVFSVRKPDEPSTAVPQTPAPVVAAERTAVSDPLDSMPVRVSDVPAAKGAATASPTIVAPAAGPDKLTMARSSAMPMELVQRACQLSGVGGALVATPDGLVIASQMPPRLSAEKAAGFLPQVYNRLGQYTRELKLGEPSQVEMLVENVPLQIYKTATVYFAVLGKVGETLPKLQLNALAAQFSARTN
jgi:predicted regulator of Ras-like GTPase activity (Roadblock/LC7/MglB family)